MLIAIKKISPDGKIPKGLLLNGKPAINDAMKTFNYTKLLDKENEKFPHSGLKATSPAHDILKRLL
jgi:hypothetical protein